MPESTPNPGPPPNAEQAAAARERVRAALREIPRAQGSLLAALHAAQHELGWLPRAAITEVARHLRLTDAQVYGPATFYAEFRTSPPPRRLVTWCSGPSCRVLGGAQVRRVLEAELGCRLGGNTEDGALGLWLGQCNGTCERAPQVWVDGRVVGPLTPAGTVRLARRLLAGEEVAAAPAQAVRIESTAVQVGAYGHGDESEARP